MQLLVVPEYRTGDPIPRIPRMHPQTANKLSPLYVLTSSWLVIWVVVHMLFQRVVFSNDLWWLQYYVPSYASGFVRRGLGGEFIRMFPRAHYFTVAYGILWASIVVSLIAIAVLMRRILSTGVRSQRRVLLALVVPVLPFALSYAIYSPHPELFGMAALVAFSCAVNAARTRRVFMLVSALYGLAIAVLALAHEAIPLQLALGAILAILVLPRCATLATKRVCAVLAVGPGIASTLLIAWLGRRDIAAQVCAQVPHGLIEHPFGVATTPLRAIDYMLGRVESRTDFHDFMCSKVIPILDADTRGAVIMVRGWGLFPLAGAFLLGVVYFIGTTGIIRHFSGVPVRAFVNEFRHNPGLPLLAVAFLVPLFVTAVDWTRWWILISFDVAVVYILYAIKRPEIDRPLSRKSAALFLYVVMALAVLPTGAANNVGVWSVHLF
ncbi:hypothetical protein [Mycobacterium sp. Marseille-P9652]|uniref:hypothetical protein n=1 Tax=Mycobacterium sp. Marseille-P9652 TaxID=2654950 RepID=UPI001E2C1191|nr:hypothetical protein [Mycobacterium sp. Marseille-P9652]